MFLLSRATILVYLLWICFQRIKRWWWWWPRRRRNYTFVTEMTSPVTLTFDPEAYHGARHRLSDSYIIQVYIIYDLDLLFIQHQQCIGPHVDATNVCLELMLQPLPMLIPFFGGPSLPHFSSSSGLLLNPTTSQCSACFGMRTLSILVTWPNHRILLSRITIILLCTIDINCGWEFKPSFIPTYHIHSEFISACTVWSSTFWAIASIDLMPWPVTLWPLNEWPGYIWHRQPSTNLHILVHVRFLFDFRR